MLAAQRFCGFRAEAQWSSANVALGWQLMLAAMEQWDQICLDHLIGDYAFAVTGRRLKRDFQGIAWNQ